MARLSQAGISMQQAKGDTWSLQDGWDEADSYIWEHIDTIHNPSGNI